MTDEVKQMEENISNQSELIEKSMSGENYGEHDFHVKMYALLEVAAKTAASDKNPVNALSFIEDAFIEVMSRH